VVSVQQWAEVRRMRFVEGLGIREIGRRTGLHRETIRRALRSSTPPRYARPARGSKLDSFREEVHRLLREDPEIESQRIRELLAEQGYAGGKTITDDYVREVRRFFVEQRTFQRTVYRPGDVAQFDLWQPKREIPVGYGQTRRGYVVVGALGFSRVGAGALVFSKEAPDVLWGMWRCLERVGALPERLVVDREGCLHAGGGRPSGAFAAFCGQLAVGWRILDAGDCQAKGMIERLQGFIETSFEPGRSFANELDFQGELDRWFDERANVRLHRTLRERPVERLEREREALRALVAPRPVLDLLIVLRVPPAR
jgi:transposase